MSKDTQFKKGQSGNPKGRPRGKRTQWREVIEELCEELNFNPFQELIRIIKTTEDSDIKLRAINSLLPYMAPKLGSMIPDDEMQQQQTIQINFGNPDDPVAQKLRGHDEKKELYRD